MEFEDIKYPVVSSEFCGKQALGLPLGDELGKEHLEIESFILILNEEFGAEVSLINSIGQRLEMNIIKYGDQFSALRQGLYDIVEFQGTIRVIKNIDKLNKASDKDLKDIYIIDLKDNVVPTLEGLKTPLSIFTAEYLDIFTKIKQYAFSIVDNLDNVISEFIGSSDVRESFLKLDGELKYAREFNEGVKGFLSRNLSNDKMETTTIGTLLRNNNEYKETLSNMVNVNKVFTNKELNKIEKKVEDIEARFEILMTVLKDPEAQLSKESLNTLTESLDLLSRFLTNLSALYYIHVRTMEVMEKVNKVI